MAKDHRSLMSIVVALGALAGLAWVLVEHGAGPAHRSPPRESGGSAAPPAKDMGGPGREAAALPDDDAGAWEACQHHVLERLETPATVTFPEEWRDHMTREEERWTFRAQVIPEGEPLEQPYFVCTVWKADDETWRLVSLEFETQEAGEVRGRRGVGRA